MGAMLRHSCTHAFCYAKGRKDDEWAQRATTAGPHFFFARPVHRRRSLTGGSQFGMHMHNGTTGTGHDGFRRSPPCDPYTSGSHQEAIPGDTAGRTHPLLPPAYKEHPEMSKQDFSSVDQSRTGTPVILRRA